MHKSESEGNVARLMTSDPQFDHPLAFRIPEVVVLVRREVSLRVNT